MREPTETCASLSGKTFSLTYGVVDAKMDQMAGASCSRTGGHMFMGSLEQNSKTVKQEKG